MTMSHSETKELFDFVLSADAENARKLLHDRLRKMRRTEPEFCAGVIEPCFTLPYTADQWVDFFSKIPNKLFSREHSLVTKLSPKQRGLLRFEWD